MIKAVESARTEGLDISANMYTYTAGATGLDAAMPPWVQEPGLGPTPEGSRHSPQGGKRNVHPY